MDGGASANDFLMQTQADIIGAPVNRPGCVETTAMGAAYLAGLAVGYWAGPEEIRKNWAIDRTFEPSIREETAGEAKRLEKGCDIRLRLGERVIKNFDKKLTTPFLKSIIK